MRAILAHRRLPLSLGFLTLCFGMWLATAASSTEPRQQSNKVQIARAQGKDDTKNGKQAQGTGASGQSKTGSASQPDLPTQQPAQPQATTASTPDIPTPSTGSSSQPDIPQPSSQGPAPGTGPAAPAGGFSASPAAASDTVRASGGSAEQQSAVQGAPSANVATGQESTLRGTTDAGDFLGKSDSIVGVETQKRQPIANETRVRGYHLGQTLTQVDGAFFFPARQDLDTYLSKLDSGSIRNVAVIKGPYTARSGPGFSFIDIETEGAPKFLEGFEFHGRTLYNYKTNGEQQYARQVLSLGDAIWGFRISYGHRIGNDYDAGNGSQIPSSYNSRDIDAAFGLNLTDNNRIEFGYLRLDQTGLEFPGQVFDTEVLVSNAYRATFLSDNQDYYDRLRVDGFYNRSSFAGNAQRPSKRAFIPQLNQSFLSGSLEQQSIIGTSVMGGTGFQAFTDGDQASAGYRAAVTWGKEKDAQLTLGTDYRYLTGEINEYDNLFRSILLDANGQPLPGCGTGIQRFGVPLSHQGTVGGLFAEAVVPSTERLTFKAGTRVDFVNMNLDDATPYTAAFLNSTLGRASGFERDFTLALLYGTLDYKLTEEISIIGGAGHAQRPPTQTELYATAPFLAVLQQGFTTVIGNPTLSPERLYQMDLGLKADFSDFHLGANGFVALIEDYITYQPLAFLNQGAGLNLSKVQSLLPGALTVRFANTDLATLVGFETFGEYDLNDWVTPFALVSYVRGEDQSLGSGYQAVNNVPVIRPNRGTEPLPTIPPLEGRVGVRFHETGKAPRYGLEVGTRIVARQDEVAASLNEQVSAGFYTVDIRSFYTFKLANKRQLLVTAGVENLFDRNYREHLDLLTGGLRVFQPGISGYFGAELRY